MALTKIGSIGINTGIAFAGVTTIATLNGSDSVLSVGGTVNFVSDVSIGGTVSIAGTLTYEDVTNVDAVGILTARSGIRIGTGGTVGPVGSGIVTYFGDGSQLTNLPAGAPVGGASTNTVFFENDNSVDVSYTISTDKNAMAAGPIAIKAGVTVTVPSGSFLTIV